MKILKYPLICILIIGLSQSVSARPIDSGNNYFSIESGSQLWQSDTGIYWNIILRDEFSGEDYIYLYGWDDDTMSSIVSQNFYLSLSSKINFNKGIATFNNEIVNITLYFDKDAGQFNMYGSKRDGDYSYVYNGDARIKGTITIDSTVYIIDGTINADHQALIQTMHSITK